jgi:chromosomal replication initiation ATPase DnaA
LRTELKLTEQSIGDIFNQHHATVIHSVNKIAMFKLTDKRTIELINQIETKLTELQTN